MTDSITPPPELLQQWLGEFFGCTVSGEISSSEFYLATRAAQWGADKELEACCDHMRDYQWGFVEFPDGAGVHRAVYLQQSRRPTPPSLKKQALEALDRMWHGGSTHADWQLFHSALQQLDD